MRDRILPADLAAVLPGFADPAEPISISSPPPWTCHGPYQVRPLLHDPPHVPNPIHRQNPVCSLQHFQLVRDHHPRSALEWSREDTVVKQVMGYLGVDC